MRPKTKRPPVAATTEGQPKTWVANGNIPFDHRGAAGKSHTIAIPREAIERLVELGIDLLDTADCESENGL